MTNEDSVRDKPELGFESSSFGSSLPSAVSLSFAPSLKSPCFSRSLKDVGLSDLANALKPAEVLLKAENALPAGVPAGVVLAGLGEAAAPKDGFPNMDDPPGVEGVPNVGVVLAGPNPPVPNAEAGLAGVAKVLVLLVGLGFAKGDEFGSFAPPPNAPNPSEGPNTEEVVFKLANAPELGVVPASPKADGAGVLNGVVDCASGVETRSFLGDSGDSDVRSSTLDFPPMTGLPSGLELAEPLRKGVEKADGFPSTDAFRASLPPKAFVLWALEPNGDDEGAVVPKTLDVVFPNGVGVEDPSPPAPSTGDSGASSDTALLGAVSVDVAIVMLGASLGFVCNVDACWPKADVPFCAKEPKPFEEAPKLPKSPVAAGVVAGEGVVGAPNDDLPKAD